MEPTRQVLRGILRIPGAVYCGVVEQSTGEVLVEVAATSPLTAEVVEWAAAVAALPNTAVDHELHDVMITSRSSYHLVRRIAPAHGRPVLAVLVLDREAANLAVARRALATSGLSDVLAATALPRLPRRSGSSRAARRWPPPPVARPAEPSDPKIPSPRWANDLSTMRQLLVGLRSLRPI